MKKRVLTFSFFIGVVSLVLSGSLYGYKTVNDQVSFGYAPFSKLAENIKSLQDANVDENSSEEKVDSVSKDSTDQLFDDLEKKLSMQIKDVHRSLSQTKAKTVHKKIHTMTYNPVVAISGPMGFDIVASLHQPIENLKDKDYVAILYKKVDRLYSAVSENEIVETESNSIIPEKNEINDAAPVDHYGFEITLPRIENWKDMLETAMIDDGFEEKTRIASTKSVPVKQVPSPTNPLPIAKTVNVDEFISGQEQQLKDIVSSIQASPKKISTQPDYSKEQEKVQDQQEKLWKEFQALEISPQEDLSPSLDISLSSPAVVSEAVQKVIRREMTGVPVASKRTLIAKNDYSKLPTVVQGPQEPIKVAKVVDAKSVFKPALPQLPADYANLASLMEKSSQKVTSQRRHVHNSKTDIVAIDAYPNRGFGKRVHNFDFVPSYNVNERFYDDGNGVIALNYGLNGTMSVLRGTLGKFGKMRTKVDLTLEEGDVMITIPFISEESFTALVQKNNLSAIGGHLLIDLNEETDLVDLDTKDFEAKIYLGDNFKQVNEDADYRYIFYLGIVPGNHMLSYETRKGAIAQKLIHITENEIYFETNSFVDQELRRIELFERNVLGNTLSELTMAEEDFNFFSTNNRGKSIATNRYQYKQPKLPIGTREYFEFKHLGYSIFAGAWHTKVMELPSDDFISYVMKIHGIDDLSSQCIVQVNLEKKISNFWAEGETAKGPMSFTKMYLYRNGSVGDEATELTQKIFLHGEMQGAINLKVEYLDGTVDMLQTYCSADGSYLIEQL